jgi:hypothetical protein
MHPVGQIWVNTHGDFSEANGTTSCRACHGSDSSGTVLSRSFAVRTLSTPWGAKTTWRGFQIGCSMCHEGPSSEVGTSNRPPVASGTSVQTMMNASVPVPLTASDTDGNALSLRIVNQPAHGTAGLIGTTAAYFPEAGFSGTDTFTFAAWDGKTNSNLATVTVTVMGSGDANGDGHVNVSDVFYLINALFASGPSPVHLSDVNGDGKVDVADVLYLINFLFAGGTPPH